MSEPTADLRTRASRALVEASIDLGSGSGDETVVSGRVGDLVDAALAALGDTAVEQATDRLMEDMRLRSMEIRGGSFDMDIAEAREMAALYVGMARAMLGDAENYTETPIGFPRAKVEFEVKIAESPDDWYVLTVQRKWGLTPHEARKKAEAERDEARETVDRVRHALEQIRARAGAAEYAMYESACADAAELLEAAMEGVGYV